MIRQQALLSENTYIFQSHVTYHKNLHRVLVQEQLANILSCIESLKSPEIVTLYKQLHYTRNQLAPNENVTKIIAEVADCFNGLSETEIVSQLQKWGQEDKLSLLRFLLVGSHPDSPVPPHIKSRVEYIFDVYSRHRAAYHKIPNKEKKPNFSFLRRP